MEPEGSSPRSQVPYLSLSWASSIHFLPPTCPSPRHSRPQPATLYCDSRTPHHSASTQDRYPVPPIGVTHLITYTDTQHFMDKNKGIYIITTDQVSTSDQPEFASSKYFPTRNYTISSSAHTGSAPSHSFTHHPGHWPTQTFTLGLSRIQDLHMCTDVIYNTRDLGV
jgi:hypothetical protein